MIRVQYPLRTSYFGRTVDRNVCQRQLRHDESAIYQYLSLVDVQAN